MSAARGVKGVVLAAGLGTRLRPLTERWPKPLIPFAGATALELALWRLADAGVKDVAVNAHYLPEQIERALAANLFGQRLHLSKEPEILGTGGCYNPLRAWAGDSDLVVLNGDVISTVDVANLVAHHQTTGAVATMALLPEVIPGESGVHYDAAGIHGFGRTTPAGMKAGNFACVQVVSPALLDLLPKAGSFDVISKGYEVALRKGMTVQYRVHQGFWHDLRTPAFYLAALLDYVKRPPPARPNARVGVHEVRTAKGLAHVAPACTTEGPVLVDASAHIDPSATLGAGVVVEGDVKIGRGAVVRRSALLAGAVVPPGAVLDGVVVAPDLSIQT